MYAISYGALFEINAAAFRKKWDTAYPGVDIAEVSFMSLDGEVMSNALVFSLSLGKEGNLRYRMTVMDLMPLDSTITGHFITSKAWECRNCGTLNNLNHPTMQVERSKQ